MKLKEVLTQKNISTGYLYFYIHLITELICFFVVSQLTDNDIIIWFTILTYDALAFVPQSLIGYLKDKYPKLKIGLIGTLLLTIGLFLFMNKITYIGTYIGIVLVAFGNAFIHIEGANVTLKSSQGHLSHSAIFVSGGSFGVALGKLLSTYRVNLLLLLILILSMIPCILLADSKLDTSSNCQKFNYHNKKINPLTIIILATLVVSVRGYMGYGIPTSWNKTVIEMIYLYFTMGLGKAIGGIITDMIGIRKVSIISTLVSIPFLIIGDNFMFLSLIGVSLFSMTMSITLGILTSVLKNNPGVAFGMTTIGLFLGTLPIFFIKITNFWINTIIVLTGSLLCMYILTNIIDKEDDYENR